MAKETARFKLVGAGDERDVFDALAEVGEKHAGAHPQLSALRNVVIHTKAPRGVFDVGGYLAASANGGTVYKVESKLQPPDVVGGAPTGIVYVDAEGVKVIAMIDNSGNVGGAIAGPPETVASLVGSDERWVKA